MNTYVTRQQVRAINRKLFANDIRYEIESDEQNDDTLELIISSIIQRYNPEDSISGVPSILELRENNINSSILDKILLMSSDSVIIQVNNSIFSNPEKVSIVKQIKNHNYTLLVEINKDDTVFTVAKLLADIIKIDIHNLPENIFKDGNKFECKKIAYNVNTPDDFLIAEASNIDYYEGLYITPSSEFNIGEHKHSKINFVKIISLLNSDCDIKDISEVISRDALMSAQVIRLSNSSFYCPSTRIESVKDAVVRIGLQSLKRWIFLLQFSKNDNIPEELLQTSYQRAVFCEEIAKEIKVKELSTNEAYLIGLLSALDILTGQTMDKEISNMGLSEVVEDALIYSDGIGGKVLNLAKAYEEANWRRLDKQLKEFKISKDKIFKLYYKSLDYTTEVWQELRDYNNSIK